MSASHLTVLKLGGSVLRDDDGLRAAVHEVHRLRRDGEQVVAVVSALFGTTDGLFDACRREAPGATDHNVAAVVAEGEWRSAARLALFLDRAGIPARLVSPHACALRAKGPVLDAEPASLDPRPIERALQARDVVVVPGFVGEDDEGRTVLLGRGGSDSTALFLAAQLGATRCRLVKDVDGLYTRDPALPFSPSPGESCPQRFATATWADALSTDGSILQHKAVAFARGADQAFELGGWNGSEPTRVGAGPTTFDEPRPSPPRVRVVLAGLGTVGGGVLELLRKRSDVFDVRSVIVRDPRACEERVVVDGRGSIVATGDVAGALEEADVFVELVGGVEPARTWTAAAIDRGVPVVSANKALAASSAGAELVRRADARGVPWRYSAAVGGCVPVLERLAAVDGVQRVRAVVNGTVNHVLDGLASGRSFDELVDEARARGWTERDAARDLDGRDAVDKLVLMARTARIALVPERVSREAVTSATGAEARSAAERGARLRQVATLELGERLRGAYGAHVALETLETGDPLASVAGESNAVVIETVSGERELWRGRGAGRWPTAEAVLGDLLELARRPRGRDARIVRAGSRGVAAHRDAPESAVAAPVAITGRT